MAHKKIGLYFGTFNPIHIGHLAIANYMSEYSDLDEVWLVITPHSPFKKKKTLLNNHHRLAMVETALEDYPNLKPSKIEFNLPQPNYTVNTLAHLEEKHTDYHFCLIMGEDNLKGLHKWKNYQVILEQYPIYVYPRISNGSISKQLKEYKSITKIPAPIMEISSTFIRNAIKEKKNVRPLLPKNVWEYIDQMNFYK